MARTVFCQKLQKEAEGLGFQLYPGELGEKIFNNISKEAWIMATQANNADQRKTPEHDGPRAPCFFRRANGGFLI